MATSNSIMQTNQDMNTSTASTLGSPQRQSPLLTHSPSSSGFRFSNADVNGGGQYDLQQPCSSGSINPGDGQGFQFHQDHTPAADDKENISPRHGQGSMWHKTKGTPLSEDSGCWMTSNKQHNLINNEQLSQNSFSNGHISEYFNRNSKSIWGHSGILQPLSPRFVAERSPVEDGSDDDVLQPIWDQQERNYERLNLSNHDQTHQLGFSMESIGQHQSQPKERRDVTQIWSLSPPKRKRLCQSDIPIDPILSDSETLSVDSPLSKIPLLMQGGGNKTIEEIEFECLYLMQSQAIEEEQNQFQCFQRRSVLGPLPQQGNTMYATEDNGGLDYEVSERSDCQSTATSDDIEGSAAEMASASRSRHNHDQAAAAYGRQVKAQAHFIGNENNPRGAIGGMMPIQMPMPMQIPPNGFQPNVNNVQHQHYQSAYNNVMPSASESQPPPQQQVWKSESERILHQMLTDFSYPKAPTMTTPVLRNPINSISGNVNRSPPSVPIIQNLANNSGVIGNNGRGQGQQQKPPQQYITSKCKLSLSPPARILSYNQETQAYEYECVFCKGNNEEEKVYKSHPIRFNDVVVCPILREHVCSICGATGDYAHTLKYCPYNHRGFFAGPAGRNSLQSSSIRCSQFPGDSSIPMGMDTRIHRNHLVVQHKAHFLPDVGRSLSASAPDGSGFGTPKHFAVRRLNFDIPSSAAKSSAYFLKNLMQLQNLNISAGKASQ